MLEFIIQVVVFLIKMYSYAYLVVIYEIQIGLLVLYFFAKKSRYCKPRLVVCIMSSYRLIVPVIYG